MKYDVPMPSLGADMDQGKLMKWMIHPGDDVKKGQVIAIVETTKSAVEIESFRDGKVLELIGKEGEEIGVGKSIASFDVPEEIPAKNVLPPRLKASPAARRLAQEKGIELSGVKASGPLGQIELSDVEALTPPEKIETVAATTGVNLRLAIGKAMSRSKKELPHYYLSSRVRLDNFMNWIDETNQAQLSSERLLIPSALLRAVVMALQAYPEFNGYFENGTFEKKSSIHLGVAVAFKGGGVMAPAILDAQTLNLAQLNSSFQDLIMRARKGELRNRELTEGTMTVTNVGDRGSDSVFGIIFPPQVALVGLGRIHKDAVVDNGGVRPGFVIDITLSADHRITDGLSGARFLAAIEKYLTNPKLLGEGNEHSGNKVSIKRDLPEDRAGDIL